MQQNQVPVMHVPAPAAFCHDILASLRLGVRFFSLLSERKIEVMDAPLAGHGIVPPSISLTPRRQGRLRLCSSLLSLNLQQNQVPVMHVPALAAVLLQVLPRKVLWLFGNGSVYLSFSEFLERAAHLFRHWTSRENHHRQSHSVG